MATSTPLTIGEAARRLELTDVGLYRLIQSGRIGVLRSREGALRIDSDALATYRRASTAAKTPPSEDIEDRVAALRAWFELQTGQDPDWFIDRWETDEIPLTPRNNHLASIGISLLVRQLTDLDLKDLKQVCQVLERAGHGRPE